MYRTPNSQTREPGFELAFAVYRFEVWAFSFSPRRPSSPSCINEYMAIDSGGTVSEWSLRVIAAWLECFPEKPSWCRNEQVCQGRKSVKRFEQSNGLDTALYKNIPLPLQTIIIFPIVDTMHIIYTYTQYYVVTLHTYLCITQMVSH